MKTTVGVLITVTCTSHASLQLPLRYQCYSPSEKIICVCDPSMHEKNWQRSARGMRVTWGLSTVCSATHKCQPRSDKREPSQAFERAHTVAHWVMGWKRRCLAVPYCTKKIVRLFMCEHTAFSNTIPKLTQTPSYQCVPHVTTHHHCDLQHQLPALASCCQHSETLTKYQNDHMKLNSEQREMQCSSTKRVMRYYPYLVWIFMCLARWPDWMNEDWQTWHTYGRSPVWVRIWFFRSLEEVVLYEQYSHA